jgi:peptide/nickel transport system permease protein
VVIFIIRRLIGTIFPLIVVSMITFAIFFLIPRLAGQNIYQLAAQYVGRNPHPAGDLAGRAEAGPDLAGAVHAHGVMRLRR